MLRAKPGPNHELEIRNPKNSSIYPVIRCIQEIPCNPCTAVCPRDSIRTANGKMTGIPQLNSDCIGCTRCVAICPGLAITLVDRSYDPSGRKALVTLPWELPEGTVRPSQSVRTVGFEGEGIGEGKVIAIRNSGWQNRRELLLLEVPAGEADKVAGIGLFPLKEPAPGVPATGEDDDNTIVCRCERVTKGEIVRYIKEHDCRDFNALKAGLRVGMGPCGGKTCTELVMRIFKQVLGRDAIVQPHVERPFTQEVPLSAFIEGGEE
jgi:ferredoxin